MSLAVTLTDKITARRAVLMKRASEVEERDMAGEGSTAWFELDVIQEEMEHLLDLQRTIHADASEKAQA